MPTSSETLVAYVPRTYILPDQNGISGSSRSVKNITANVQQLADVSNQPVRSTTNKGLIVAAVITGLAIATGAAVAFGILLSANGITTTTTTTTTTTDTTTTAMAAPTNMVSYRGNTGQTYTFVLTGSSSGGIWGTTIYTDDSNIATAAVHAGFVQVNQISTVTLIFLAGQSSYTSSTQNGITSSSWGSWPGSYSFVSATGR